MTASELARFLRLRRESLRPDQVGLRRDPSARTPGLRREEVAALAGVTVGYYERLEQARARHPSPQVVRALGNALRLSGPELDHLARLAGHAPPPEPVPTAVPDEVRQLVDRLGPIPAYVLNPTQDFVAWNAMAVALFVDFAQLPPADRNLVRLSFRLGGTVCGEPEQDAGGFAARTAAELRAASGRYPGLPGLDGLVAAFVAHSPGFAEAWSAHDVRERPVVRKVVDHELLGRVELDSHVLTVPGHDLRLTMFTAEPGSASAELLAKLYAEL
ncbi:transcriptional regulator with XRE-family HTH domain [Crossiella equi]|uniref:Transcriptional regulator with XRE-family HTH domain n=1 Tax=Crossiella equi TaxID=130796 RepID=A0ABS5A7A3_9PSEU|nr:helix-turn-helix transcriptional regulator [Crossiella equi]MBP2472477.1 transcriptional regulator with XRE-family HTH domain [Crossiella equi]